ncbi:hypothetical protein [Cognatilysobacter bugurensis]|uniref:Uncharacterized protein n=1 Tax=Cognatilysobacter bugurensis TaxID=543356 RepID=A0A918SYG6_9GAMM|nr:hypothetical protein [Lysobacter bugurensis]GHA79240.1 hypothetical protein GCM10007067_15890 [Lysobacter bugurensis]
MTRLAPSRLAGMAAPMVVWAVHFVLVYSLTGLACADAWKATEWLGVRRLIWALLLWSAVALALIAWLGQRARRMQHRIARDIEAADDARRRELERQCFAARMTSLLALLAAVAVAFTAVPMFVLPDCT